MSILEGLLGIGSAAGGGMMVQDAYDQLGNIGDSAMTGSAEIAQSGLGQTAFNPYGVQTSTGSQMGVDASGNVNMTLGAQEQAIQNQALGSAQGLLGSAGANPAAYQQDFYEQMRALQRGEEERAALQLENRLFAQGRLGAGNNAYGGATPEQLAMQSANATSRNQAALMAMQNSLAQQQGEAQLANAFLGMGYVPQAQLQNAGGFGFNNAQLYQQGQLAGADLYGNAMMGGLEAQLGARQGQANLAGNIGSSLLGGSLQSASGENGWIEALGGLFS